MDISNVKYLESERIVLRLCRKEDAQELKDLFDAPLSEEQTEMMIAHFLQSQTEGKEADLAIEDKENGKVVGILSLYDVRKDGTLALGYRVRPEERQQHYATDAVSLVTMRLMEEYGAAAIRASADTANLASINVLTNSGFKLIAQHASACMFLFDRECAERRKKAA